MNRFVAFFLLIFTLFSIRIYGQCDVEAFANPYEICAGQTVSLWATGGCGILMYNDFNGGTPGAGWTATTGVDFSNPCGTGPNAIYLWMGNNVPIPRTLTTVPFNVSTACTISFWLRFSIQGQSSPCEGPDLVGEGVSLQYSTDGGGTWADIAYFRPDGVICPSYPNTSGFTSVGSGTLTAFTTWDQYSFPVPAAAASPNTMFRWRQHAYSSQGNDHWGIDVVEIMCPGTTDVLWSHGPTVLDPPDVAPTTTTTYYVTVYDTVNGLSATDSVTIIVNPGPTADFSATTVCEGDATDFTDLSTPMTYPITTWDWTFGDGNNSTQQNPSHTYAVTGTYDVTLYIEDQHGCADQITKPVSMHPSPQVDFTAQPTSGCEPLSVNFQNQTTISGGGSVSSLLWDFGNGNTSTAQSPSATYGAGDYDITLTATSDNGCTSSLTMTDYINVYPNPIAEFSYSPSENYLLNPVYFQDLSIGASQWYWDFGDGSNSDIQNPTHSFQNSGNFSVSLYVENQWGCSDETSMTINILNNDIIYFPNAFTPNGDGINDYFGPYGMFWSSDGYDMKIFNRYGELIFFTTDLNTHWDGRHKRTGEIVQMGVYPYRVFIRSLSGKEFLFEGQVTVVH